MSGAIFDDGAAVVRLLGAVGAAGVAIKLMDDYLDRDLDALTGRRTLATAVGSGIIAYALAALAFGMLLDGPVAGSLFLAAYAIGMAYDPARLLPTGLTAWQESLLVTAAGLILVGPRIMAASLAAMIFVQGVDDLLDAAEDRRRGQLSLVARLGIVETGLLAGAALLVALALDPLLMTAVLVAAGLIEDGLRWMERRLPPGVGERAGEGLR